MAVTRLKRKNRRNKTVSRQWNQALKLNARRVDVKSPYKDQTVIVED